MSEAKAVSSSHKVERPPQNFCVKENAYKITAITLIVLSILTIGAGYLTYSYGLSDAVNLSLWASGSLILFFTLVISALVHCSKKERTQASVKKEPTASVKSTETPTVTLSDWPSVLNKAKNGCVGIQDWEIIYQFLKSDPRRALDKIDNEGQTIIFLAVEDGNHMAVVTIDQHNKEARNTTNNDGETPLEVAQQLQFETDDSYMGYHDNLTQIIGTLGGGLPARDSDDDLP